MQILLSGSIDTDIEDEIAYIQRAVCFGQEKNQIDPVETRSMECDLHHVEDVRVYQR